MTSAFLNIRSAVVADARGIASVHLRAWQWAYRGQIPDAYLDSLTQQLDQRTAWWHGLLSQPPPEHRTWVAERDGCVLGFADTGPCRDADATSGVAELNAIYLDPAVVGTGVGRALMIHVVQDLKARGFRAATLWVLATNQRARRFYEIGGWQLDGTEKTEHGQNFTLHEFRYTIDLTGGLSNSVRGTICHVEPPRRVSGPGPETPHGASA